MPTVALSGSPVAYRLPDGATFGPRRLRDFEFVWMLSGYAEVQLDQARHCLRPGQLQLSRPGMIDFYVWQGQQPSHAFVHFRVVNRGRLPAIDEWPTVVDLPHQGTLPGLLTDLGGLHTHEDRPAAEEVTALLLDRFVTTGPDGGRPRVPPAPFVSDLTSVLKRHWTSAEPTNPIEVGRLAEDLSLSRSQLTRLSHRHFGASPREVVELVRLSRAAMLLRRTNLPVRTIAYSSGFGDSYHFAKRFRLHYGVTATQYRAGSGPPPGLPLAERSGSLHELGRRAEAW